MRNRKNDIPLNIEAYEMVDGNDIVEVDANSNVTDESVDANSIIIDDPLDSTDNTKSQWSSYKRWTITATVHILQLALIITASIIAARWYWKKEVIYNQEVDRFTLQTLGDVGSVGTVYEGDSNLNKSLLCDEISSFRIVNFIPADEGVIAGVNDRIGYPKLTGCVKRDSNGTKQTQNVAFFIETLNNGTATVGLYQAPNGYVGLGTKNPQYQLDINSTVKIRENLIIANAGSIIFDDPFRIKAISGTLYFYSTYTTFGGLSFELPAFTIAATGNVTISQSLFSPTGSFTTASIAQTLSVGGASTITGAVSLQSTLNVAGATVVVGAVSLQSTLNAAGAMTGGSTLSVAGASTLTGAVSAGSTLNVVSTTTFGGAISALSTANIAGNTVIGAGSVLVTVNGDLTVTGTFTNPSSMTIKQNITNLDADLAKRVMTELNPVTYFYTDDYLQVKNETRSEFPKAGLTAESTRNATRGFDKVTSDIQIKWLDGTTATILGIAKIELLPFMIKDHQTLRKEVETLTATVLLLQSRLNNCTTC